MSFAQEQWERDGEIEDVEIEIVRERQIVLPKANRNFEKISPRPSEPIKPAIVYEFKNLNFSVPDYRSQIRPLRLKQEDIPKIYGNFVSAGFGNYSSPYLNAWLNTKRDKSRYLGVHMYHRSFGKGPVDGKNSASGNTEIGIFGKSFNNSVTTGGSLNYENNTGHFYGYSPGLETKRDSIKQSYDRFSLSGEVSNTRTADFNYKLSGYFNYLTDHYKAAESDLGLSFVSDYKLNEKTLLKIDASYAIISRKDSLVEATPRNLLKVAPLIQFNPLDKLTIAAGARVVLENDSIRSKSFHIYPMVQADYTLSDKINAYASLRGDMEKVSLHTTSAENFWVNSNVGLFHTNKSLEFLAGIRGTVGKQLSFDIGVSASNLKDFYFYQNSTLDRAKFDLVYDLGNTQRVNFYGELGLNKNEVVRFNVRGDYFTYATDQLAEAWHRPTYRFSFNSAFNIYEKVLINVGMVGQGGMKAFNNETSMVEELKGAFDLNAQATYRVSRQVSVFLKFENMLSNGYPVYLYYPVRGFQVLGGASVSF